jgi:hypothetical protein
VTDDEKRRRRGKPQTDEVRGLREGVLMRLMAQHGAR